MYFNVHLEDFEILSVEIIVSMWVDLGMFLSLLTSTDAVPGVTKYRLQVNIRRKMEG